MFTYAMLRYLGLFTWLTKLAMDLNIQMIPESCSGLYTVGEIVVIADIFLLEGMMTARVYVLLEKPKTLLYVLLTGFSAAQVINIIISVDMIKLASFSEISVAGLYICDLSGIAQLEWTYPFTSALLLAYEAILIGCSVFCAVKHLRGSLWTNLTHFIDTLTAVIIRDNLAYFFIAFLGFLIRAIGSTLAGSPTTFYLLLSTASEVAVLSMIGPWMILSLRKSDTRLINGGVSAGNEVTTVEFAAAVPQNEGEA